MKKAPMNLHAHGAIGQQLSFLPEVELSLNTPHKGTREELALFNLAIGTLNQIEWLVMQQGWRLAVTINSLRNMGWAIQTEMKCLPNGVTYAEYSFANEKQRQMTLRLRRQRMKEGS